VVEDPLLRPRPFAGAELLIGRPEDVKWNLVEDDEEATVLDVEYLFTA
jgi:hypothetical protein